MATTITVLAWIGLGTVVVLGGATLWAWGDQLARYFFKEGLRSRGILRALRLWLYFEINGGSDDSHWTASQLASQFSDLCRDEPETARMLYRLIRNGETDGTSYICRNLQGEIERFKNGDK